MSRIHVSASLAAAFLGFTSLLTAAPTLPTIPARDFLVTSYGAVADDGITDNTGPIQAALNAASAAGGGTVEFPGGTSSAPAIYMTGPGISVPSNINFQVDQYAVLRAFPCASTTSPGRFTNGASEANIITVPSSSNVEFSGLGTIDGNGGSQDVVNETGAVVGGWWTNSGLSRPRILNFTGGVSNIEIIQLTFTNPPEYHVYFSPSGGLGASNVTVNGITVNTSSTSPNTDGVDPSGAHVLIENCTIGDGDDDIAVKAQNILCTDITITNCTFASGHGLSVGGQTNSGLNGMTVSNCTFNGTQYGFRLKADPTEGGTAQNITYSNCVMNGVEYPIIFYSWYSAVGTPGQTAVVTAAGDNATPTHAASGYTLPTSLMPTWQNITVNNLTINDPSTTNYSLIWGLLDTPTSVNGMFQNVTLNNVNFTGGSSNSHLSIYNAQNVQFTSSGTGTGTILPPSGNTLGLDGLAILAQPSTATVANGGTATFTVGVLPTKSGSAGTTTVTPLYQWTFNGTALTNGTQPDGSVISGATGPTLTVTGALAAEAGAYAAVVTESLDAYNAALIPGGNTASATSAPATLTISPFAPSLTSAPVAQTVVVGGDVTFTVLAPGNPAPTYQWFINGTAAANGATGHGSSLSGSLTPALTLSAAQLLDSGDSVSVTVSNSVGSVSSTPVALTVLATYLPSITSQPASVTAGAGTQVILTVAAAGTPAPTYQWFLNGTTAISQATSSSLILSNVQPQNAGTYTVTVSNSQGSVVSAAAVLTVNYAPVVATPPAPLTVNAGSGATFSVVAADNPPPTAYQWFLNNSAISGATSSTYAIASAAPANAGSYTVTVSNPIGSITTTGASLTVDYAPSIVAQPSPATANVLAGSSVTFSAGVAAFPAPTYQWSVGGTPLTDGTKTDGSTVSGSATAALNLGHLTTAESGSYTLVAQNTLSPAATTSAAVLTVVATATAAAPVITTAPTAATVGAGTAATFTAAASGSPAPSFQWSYNGTVLAGATSSTYTIPATTLANAGNYGVLVSNQVGSVLSTPVSLTVDTAPSIITQPLSQSSLPVGSPASLSVVATAIPAPTYQWSFAGTAIAGATSTTYTIQNMTSSTAGSYTVTVSNALGSVTSAAASLAIISYPAGAYIGNFGTQGQFAIQFNGAGSGDFLAYDPSSGVAVVQVGFTVVNNVFSFTLPGNGSSAASGISPDTAQAPVTLTVSGTISGGILTGTVTGPATPLAFSGAPWGSSTGSAQSSAGFYQTGAVGSSATLSFIIAADGGVYALALTPTGPVAGIGDLNSSGVTIAVTTTPGVSMTGTSNAGVITVNLVGTTTTVFTGGPIASVSDSAMIDTKGLASVGTGDSRAIEGFVLAGTARPILLLGLGPELNGLGYSGSLTTTELDLYNVTSSPATVVVPTASGPGNSTIQAAAQSDLGIALQSGALDSADLTTLGTPATTPPSTPAPAAYTAILSGGPTGATGLGMVNVFDTGSAAAGQYLLNTSLRGLVPAGGSLVHGFTVTGTVATRYLIRAVGPGLSAFPPITPALLAAPSLTVHSVQTGLQVGSTNTGWGNSADGANGNLAAAALTAGAFPLVSAGDSALLLTLNPGSYTATVTSSVAGGSGLVLIEVYQLP